MAPFRGRGRGSYRGGRGGGRVAKPSGKLARSGIRTKTGYRKFDSQRVKDVESDGSEDEVPEVEEDVVQEDDLSNDSEEEFVPRVKAYSALMQSFQQSDGLDGRKRKRRKLEVQEPAEVDEAEDEVFEDGGVYPEVDDDDAIDEDEEAAQPGNGPAGLNVNDDDDDEDGADPFEAHFANTGDEELSKRLTSIQANEWWMEKQAASDIGSFTVSVPRSLEGGIVRGPTIRRSTDLNLKRRLAESSSKRMASFDGLQQAIAPYLFNYNDVLLGNRTPRNAESLRSIACLHALNHVLKGRDKVLKNTNKLAQAEDPDSLDLRDQGFTRPKVLILTETRQMAYNYGQSMIDFFAPDQVENRQRFTDSFTGPIDDRDTMPEDYRELFDGNNDNSFLTAIKFTRKTLKFFSAFYTSDIILASALGLRRLIENEDAKKRDHDFLSSIEIVVTDQADAMQMQSWENVEVVVKHLNLQPRESHGTDFNRVRTYYLDGNAKFLRQTIVFSAYITPEINRLSNSSMLNIAGKAKLAPSYDGAITAPSLSGLGVKQTFSRFSSPSPAQDPDARFQYFTTAVLPSLLKLPKPSDGAHGILVFIPSYFDFIRIRNYFATSALTANVSFGSIHDYTAVPDQRRARSHFLSGRHSILLYTQRAHHFFRLKIRGVKRIVMYGVPDNPMFYDEMVGEMLGTSLGESRVAPEEAGVRACFSKWDSLRMERVVGSGRVKGMLGGVGDTFDFV